MYKEELLELKAEAERAQKAYFNYEKDGSLESDLEEARLSRKYVKANNTYFDAITRFLENEK